jgi:glutamate dehydrogenase
LRLDPVRFDDTDAKARALERKLESTIDAVESLDEDRILRGFLRVVRAVLRTNYFQTDSGGQAKSYLSLKLDPDLVPDLPEPRPMFEVFVYSPRVEAVHLRGGKVARGGIRWSDRREDFRTEVLGLMKAQTVKNAVIVPVGAKGGFVVKRPPAGGDRAALLEEVVECYRTFMRGLLDVTDTIAGGKIVPPPDVVRHDEDDPYLVVAADKGHRDLLGHGERDRDRVRLLARRRVRLRGLRRLRPQADGDHRPRRLGVGQAPLPRARHDIENADFTGVGDRRHVGRRVRQRNAALARHQASRRVRPPARLPRPGPDPERSFAERGRLFALPGSSWADYDPKLISPGGGVFPRSAKSIPLSPEVRAALDVTAETLTPSELIRALLRAPVDLLWNGGIGTYVKAKRERHAEVGDKTNDAVRVDAEELRCRVVGEGGNLGFTQRARIAFARAAGASTWTRSTTRRRRLLRPRGQHQDPARRDRRRRRSDREAAERDARRDGGRGGRRSCCATTTSRRRRSRARRRRRLAMVEVHVRFVRGLEQAGTLNRELEALPTDEGFDEREAAGAGLTAPEFATLLSHTKIALAQELLASDLPEDPIFAASCRRTSLTARRALRRAARTASAAPRDHRLARRQRPREPCRHDVRLPAPRRDGRRRGRRRARVHGRARAVRPARPLGGDRGARRRVSSATQTAMALKARILLERTTRWLLRTRRRPIDVGQAIDAYATATAALAGCVRDLLGPVEAAAAHQLCTKLVDAGVPEPLAARVAHAEALVPSASLAEIADDAELDVPSVAGVYFALGARLELAGSATASSPCRATRAGRRWRARRCATTSTPSRPR